MKNEFDKPGWMILIFTLSCILIYGTAAGIVIGVNTFKCDRLWSDSGVSSRYKVFVGCQLQRKDGTWYPASAFREPSK